MTATPLLTRIAERRDKRIGPVCPTPIQERMSPFAKRLAQKNLVPADKTFWLHDMGPDGTPAA